MFCHRGAMSAILIVDDDDAFRESLTETLVDLGHAVVQVGSGHDALACLAREGAIDCVFLDFRLPDIDGLAVLKRLRAMPARADVAVVMLTGFATSDNTIHAMRLGAFEHLTKPVGRDAIADLLKKIGASVRPESASAAPEPSDIDIGDAPRLYGTSEALREVQKQIGRAATSDSTVL